MPISITASTSLLAKAKKLYQPLLTNGVEIGWTPNRVILRKVPAGFRQFSWAECLSDILDTANLEPNEVRKHLLSSLAKNRELTDEQIQHWWEGATKSEQGIKSMGQLMPLNDWITSYVE